MNERIDSHDSYFEELRRKGKFWEGLVHGWGFVESDIDCMVLDEFKLLTEKTLVLRESKDPRISHLLRLNFGRKMELLKQCQRLSVDESEVIKKFADKRNELFHGGNYDTRRINLPEAKKNELLNLAASALKASLEGVSRRRK